VWLTETAVGGGGALEKFQQRYGEDPRRFFDLLSRALDPTDVETAHEELARFLARVTDPGEAELAEAVERVRAGHTRPHAELVGAFDALLRALRARDFATTHPVVAALAARLLRAGTSSRSDQLLRGLLVRWDADEARLGVEIDARTFAWLASGDGEVADSLAVVVGAPLAGRGQRFAAVSGLLWPRGSAARGQRLQARNPYLDLGAPERELLLAVLPPAAPAIPLADADAAERVRVALLADGVAVVVGDAPAAREAALRLAAEPIDTGAVLAYPRVRSATRAGGAVTLTLELAEVAP
jgi:hypothetical protein